MLTSSPNSISPTLSIRLLGPYEVQVDERTLPPRHSRKEQWLLALLILRHGRTVERDWLADTLWPDSSRSRILLRDTLYDLRQTLGCEAVRLSSPTKQTLQLDLAGVEVDVLEFDAALRRGDTSSLEQAIHLYRGALLEGCIEEWVHPERQAREQAYLNALERLAQEAMVTGRTIIAIGYLKRVVAIDVLRESAHCRLMQAFADQGDYAALVSTFRDLRLSLYRELHAEPSAETAALFHRLREQGRSALRSRPVSAPPPPPSLPLDRHNLPPALTSFIGREQQREEIKFLLGKSRLLTLTGSGGCGKTRLALEVAAEVREDNAEGVWLVELAALSDPALVARSVAGALGLKEEADKPIEQTLLHYLKERRVLLILDNCEHLLEACATLSDALLQHCLLIRLFTTSRERLGIRGEQIYPVPPLSLPSLPARSSAMEKGVLQGMTLQSLMESESVRLFLERAITVLPTFALTTANARSLAQVCIRLDGIPLAIELAAVRVRSLSVEEIAKRLDDRFRLLTGGSRTALRRQQTLRALIDWSYDLLENAERTLFARLSVFAGGWTLEATETVCVGEGIEDWEILDLLTSLADKNLVVYVPDEEGAGRYRLLETMRQYAEERLAKQKDTEAVRIRHRDYFLALAEEAELNLAGADQAEWYRRLEEEHDNLRAALTFCQEEAEGGEKGLRLGRALGQFWWTRGHLSEARKQLMVLLSHPGVQERNRERSDVLSVAGVLARSQGDYASARLLHEENLAIRRELGNRRGIAGELGNLGNVAFSQGDYASARVLHEECLEIQRELGIKLGIANSLCNLGLVANAQGDYASARSLHEEDLGIQRELGNRGGIANSLGNLGNVAVAQGDHASAQALYEEALLINREIGNRFREATNLNGLGNVAVSQGDYVLAGALYEEGLEIYRELGHKLSMTESLGNLGNVACAQGDYALARSLYEKSLEMRKDLGIRRSIADALEAFAFLALKEGNAERGVRLCGAVSALNAETGLPLPPNALEKQERELTAVRKVLGEDAFIAVWEEGCSMTLEQTIAYTLQATGE